MARVVDIHGAGRHGEDRAARHYVERGYAVVARNWRWPGGEIDIVVVRDDQLVVVEVRVRSSDSRGSAAVSVGINWMASRKRHARALVLRRVHAAPQLVSSSAAPCTSATTSGAIPSWVTVDEIFSKPWSAMEARST